jgi:hypothetical protein
MNFNKYLIKSIEDSMDLNGVSIELSSNFKEDYFVVTEELEKDNIRTYISGGYLDSYMFLYHFAKMLEENKITITFNESATEKDIDYFEKLSEDMVIKE